MNHLWQKTGTNVDDTKGLITRAWSCKHCAATKIRVSQKKVAAPRPTVSRTVSAERCSRAKAVAA